MLTFSGCCKDDQGVESSEKQEEARHHHSWLENIRYAPSPDTILFSTFTIIDDCVYIDIDLKKASKSFAQHFSCGSSVTGEDEIVIQGDVTDDVIDFIQEKWPEVNE